MLLNFWEYGYRTMMKTTNNEDRECPTCLGDICENCIEESGSDYFFWLGDGTKPDFEERDPFDDESN